MVYEERAIQQIDFLVLQSGLDRHLEEARRISVGGYGKGINFLFDNYEVRSENILLTILTLGIVQTRALAAKEGKLRVRQRLENIALYGEKGEINMDSVDLDYLVVSSYLPESLQEQGRHLAVCTFNLGFLFGGNNLDITSNGGRDVSEYTTFDVQRLSKMMKEYMRDGLASLAETSTIIYH